MFDWIEQLNNYGKNRKSCFFLIDYSTQKGEVYSLDVLKQKGINFAFPNLKIETKNTFESTPNINFSKEKIDFNTYKKAFDNVLKHLNRGDSYLLNLTFSTPIHIDIDLDKLYSLVSAKYKISYKNNWVCFSPETFIKINDNQISTYPMKGTIDAEIPNAEEVLRNDFKEKAEHSTIVDLLRNDLSMVAKKVRVNQLMYMDKIHTNQGDILQMSSEIIGNLNDNWHQNLGNILAKLLPAGSICGAPKKRTLEIIQESENYDRGFYTGIAGYYDGKSLDTCVLIRFIENTEQGLVYKSGGGITAMSDIHKEYNELNQKIYVPIH